MNMYTDQSRFQFHKGTIKTKFPKRDKSGAIIFQFHKGTIKTLNTAAFVRAKQHAFNSIKVRLKRFKPASEC